MWICFRAWMVKLFVFGANWKQVGQTFSGWQRIVFVVKKTRKKIENEQLFFQVFGFNFCLGSQNCSWSVHRSIFRYYFYCQKRHFFNVFLIGAETFPTPGDFSRQNFKTRFSRPEVHFQVKCFLEKFSAFLSRVLGIYWNKSHFLSKIQSRRSKLQWTCPEEQSPQKSFLNRKFGKGGWAEICQVFGSKTSSGLSKMS